MATIAENLQRIETAKSDIRTAIIGKGVDVPSGDTIDTYAAKINSISTGSTLKVQNNRDVFYDTNNRAETIYPDDGYDVMSKVDVEIKIPPMGVQSTKFIGITENGDKRVHADDGYDTMREVWITTNVPIGGWDSKYAVFDKNVTFYNRFMNPFDYIEIEFKMTTSGSVFTTNDGENFDYGLSVDSGNNWTFSYYDNGDGGITRQVNIGQLEYNGLDMHFIASFKDYANKTINLTLSNNNGCSISKTINNSGWYRNSQLYFYCPFYIDIDATANTNSDRDFKLRYLKLGINDDYQYYVYSNSNSLKDLKNDNEITVYGWDVQVTGLGGRRINAQDDCLDRPPNVDLAIGKGIAVEILCLLLINVNAFHLIDNHRSIEAQISEIIPIYASAYSSCPIISVAYRNIVKPDAFAVNVEIPIHRVWHIGVANVQKAIVNPGVLA